MKIFHCSLCISRNISVSCLIFPLPSIWLQLLEIRIVTRAFLFTAGVEQLAGPTAGNGLVHTSLLQCALLQLANTSTWQQSISILHADLDSLPERTHWRGNIHAEDSWSHLLGASSCRGGANRRESGEERSLEHQDDHWKAGDPVCAPPSPANDAERSKQHWLKLERRLTFSLGSGVVEVLPLREVAQLIYTVFIVKLWERNRQELCHWLV